jgi:CheY-like chemotaxis protein
MTSKNRPLRILVVDDNEDAANSLATLVSLWGHEVRAALDGAAAIVEASDFLPDAVLCDLAMPGIDGCRVAESLRRHAALSRTLLLAVTAHGDKEHRRRAARAGFHGHLVKPLDTGGLHRLLEAHAAHL